MSCGQRQELCPHLTVQSMPNTTPEEGSQQLQEAHTFGKAVGSTRKGHPAAVTVPCQSQELKGQDWQARGAGHLAGETVSTVAEAGWQVVVKSNQQRPCAFVTPTRLTRT